MKIGDVVKLKGGGPSMTIDSIKKISDFDKTSGNPVDTGRQKAICFWFVNAERRQAEFALESLTPEEPPKPDKKIVKIIKPPTTRIPRKNI